MIKEKHKFSPGDRVILTTSEGYIHTRKGMTGTVIDSRMFLGGSEVHVSWDQLGGDHLDVFEGDLDPFDGPAPAGTSKRWSIDRVVTWFAQASFTTWFIALYLAFTILDIVLWWVLHESISKELFALYGIKNLVIACGFALSYQIKRMMEITSVTIINNEYVEREPTTRKASKRKQPKEDHE